MIDTGHLFVYGTLMPGRRAWPVVAEWADDHAADVVRGTLWDTGRGFPALTLQGPGATDVPGVVLRLTDAVAAPALAELDRYEGLGPDRYRRSRVTSGSGVVCWTYEWVGPTEGFRRLGAGWPPDHHTRRERPWP